MTPMEKDIEKALGRMIGRLGGMCLKWVCPGWTGVPDRIILLPGGRIIFVELKRSKSSNGSAMQIWWSRKLKDLGFAHYWVKSHEEVRILESVIREQIQQAREVHWSRPGPCPVTPEQFEAIYNDAKEDEDVVTCKECKHLTFSDCYGECGRGHRGIVKPWDSCPYGEREAKP